MRRRRVRPGYYHILLLATSSAMVVFLGLSFLVAGLQSFDMARELQGTSLAHTVSQVADRISSTISLVHRQLGRLDPANIAAIKGQLLQSGFVNSLAFLDAQGNVRAILENDLDEPLVQAPGKSGEGAPGQPLGRPMDGLQRQDDLVFEVTGFGTMYPSFRLNVDWGRLDRYLQQFLAPLRDSLVVDSFMLDAVTSRILSGPRDQPAIPEDLAALIRDSGDVGGWTSGIWQEDGVYVSAWGMITFQEGVQGSSMVMLLRQRADVAWAPFTRLLPQYLGYGLLLALVYHGVLIVIARGVTRPLVDLTEEVRALGRGEIHSLSPGKGPKEIVDLTRAFTRLLSDLEASARARRTAEEVSIRDPLTGLPNRRALDGYLRDALVWGRGDLYQVFLFLDLDGFKGVNDRHGHDAGDAVLEAVASRLRKTAPKEALCIRLGGDEFVVVLPLARTRKSPVMVAERLAGSIIQAVEVPIEWKGEGRGSSLRVGASLGLALWPRDGSDPSEVLNGADKAMYKAKDAGKHCFRWFRSPV